MENAWKITEIVHSNEYLTHILENMQENVCFVYWMKSFEVEKLTRLINDCRDLEQLREMALALVQQVAQQKAASAWMASRATESENAKLELLAEVIRRRAASGSDSTPQKDWLTPGLVMVTLPAGQARRRKFVAMFCGHLQHTAVVITAMLNFGAQGIVALHSRHEWHQLLHRHNDSEWGTTDLARRSVRFR